MNFHNITDNALLFKETQLKYSQIDTKHAQKASQLNK